MSGSKPESLPNARTSASARCGHAVGKTMYKIVPILLQKSFCTRDQNFFWLYTRLWCKYVGDLIAEDKLAGGLGNVSKYPPAKPGALVLEPLKAACPCRTRQSVPSTLWNAPHLMTC